MRLWLKGKGKREETVVGRDIRCLQQTSNDVEKSFVNGLKRLWRHQGNVYFLLNFNDIFRACSSIFFHDDFKLWFSFYFYSLSRIWSKKIFYRKWKQQSKHEKKVIRWNERKLFHIQNVFVLIPKQSHFFLPSKWEKN